MSRPKTRGNCPASLLPSSDKMIGNILAAYARAFSEMPAERFHASAVWYATANKTVRAIARTYKVPVRLAVWLTAYLSQNAAWNVNVDSVHRILDASRNGSDIGAAGAYASGRMIRRVAEVLAAFKADGTVPTFEQLTVPGSPAFKVVSFAHNIADPAGLSFVTVDRHAARIATGDDTVGVPNGGAYRKVADAYRRAALVLGVSPATVQAVTWTARVGDLP